jgi:hypothetical protein
MNTSEFFRLAAEPGQGVLRLAPTWVPRAMLRPGGRLRLHPNDLYALGGHRGGIDERWLASNVVADNGPGTPPDEGLSYVEFEGNCVPLREFTGDTWQVLCKLFDNAVPIPLHVHPSDAQARPMGKRGKPEAYYYPAQYNANPGAFPYTFFGLQTHTSRDAVRRCLQRWSEGDNGILNLSQAYKLKPGTGWQVDTNILHAPGTMVTYEPQAPSDIGAKFESMCAGDPVPWDALNGQMPDPQKNDLDYILSWIDFEKNTDPFFAQFNYREPIKANDSDLHIEKWIVYGSPHFSARELAVAPGATVRITDARPYGALVVQGRGTINGLDCEVPTLIRYGQMTADEFFVTAEAAAAGVAITNASRTEPLVILKCYGPGHPEAEEFIECKSE